MEEERKDEEIEPTEVYPIDPKKETIHFPWSIAIIMGILTVLIIACFIIIWILEH